MVIFESGEVNRIACARVLGLKTSTVSLLIYAMLPSTSHRTLILLIVFNGVELFFSELLYILIDY